jgi:catalase
MANTDAGQFIGEAYKHCKAIAASGAAGDFVTASCFEANFNGKVKGEKPPTDPGIIIGPDAQPGKIATSFIKAIAQHRHWSREMKDPGFE